MHVIGWLGEFERSKGKQAAGQGIQAVNACKQLTWLEGQWSGRWWDTCPMTLTNLLPVGKVHQLQQNVMPFCRQVDNIISEVYWWFLMPESTACGQDKGIWVCWVRLGLLGPVDMIGDRLTSPSTSWRPIRCIIYFYLSHLTTHMRYPFVNFAFDGDWAG